MRRLWNKLENAEYDLRKAKRDFGDVEETKGKATRDREAAKIQEKKARKGSGKVDDDLTQGKRRTDDAERKLKKTEDQLAVSQNAKGSGPDSERACPRKVPSQ